MRCSLPQPQWGNKWPLPRDSSVSKCQYLVPHCSGWILSCHSELFPLHPHHHSKGIKPLSFHFLYNYQRSPHISVSMDATVTSPTGISAREYHDLWQQGSLILLCLSQNNSPQVPLVWCFKRTDLIFSPFLFKMFHWSYSALSDLCILDSSKFLSPTPPPLLPSCWS